LHTQQELDLWLLGRPKTIQILAERLKPWITYRVKSTGQHCTLLSYFENGTVSVEIVGHDSEVLNMINSCTSFGVFGLLPDDLEEI